jgi:hypothetical protein
MAARTGARARDTGSGELEQTMTLVNSLCAEISIYQGVGEATGVMVERRAIRGKKGLCKSMRDLAIKSRVLGDGYYYLPVELWPSNSEPVVVHKHDWTVIGSIPRSSRPVKKGSATNEV